MNKDITALQAFNAVEAFLEVYFKETSSDSLGALLSCMLFLDDDETADPALWQHWQVLCKNYVHLTPAQAFDIAYAFLKHYFRNSSSATVKRVLDDMSCVKEGKIQNAKTEALWLTSIDTVLAEGDDSMHYLHLKKEL